MMRMIRIITILYLSLLSLVTVHFIFGTYALKHLGTLIQVDFYFPLLELLELEFSSRCPGVRFWRSRLGFFRGWRRGGWRGGLLRLLLGLRLLGFRLSLGDILGRGVLFGGVHMALADGLGSLFLPIGFIGLIRLGWGNGFGSGLGRLGIRRHRWLGGLWFWSHLCHRFRLSGLWG